MADGKKNQAVTYIILGLICALIGFGAGWALKTKPSTPVNRTAFGSTQFGSGSGGGGRFSGGGSFARGGRTIGTVLSVLTNGYTVQLPTGSSETVDTNSSTTYTEQASTTSSSVTQGTSILVSGTPNSDGSITATTIAIQPASTTTSSTTTN